jgi:hypothetical protein
VGRNGGNVAKEPGSTGKMEKNANSLLSAIKKLIGLLPTIRIEGSSTLKIDSFITLFLNLSKSNFNGIDF